MDWSYIIKLFLPLIIKYGPEWLLKIFPKLPDWAMSVIKELLEALSKATTPEEKKAARKRAVNKCKGGSGVGCPTELK